MEKDKDRRSLCVGSIELEGWEVSVLSPLLVVWEWRLLVEEEGKLLK